MRKIALVLVIVTMCSLLGCAAHVPTDTPNTQESTHNVPENTRIEIPDIYDVDEDTAKSVLSANALIPTIKHEYSDNIAEGNVIKTEPMIGTNVEKNSKVTVYISQGSAYIESKNAKIKWYLLSDEEDYWNLYRPYIDEGILYIPCFDVTFGCDVTWDDEYNYGELYGIASITDSFDNSVLVTAKYEKQSWKAGESQDFTLEIPLSDLGVDRPTDIYMKLCVNETEYVEVNVCMTW